MSRDEATGATSAQRVVQTFEKQAAATLVLRLKNGEIIETTKEHPFYVESQGFTPAGEMGIGTSIVTRAGPSAILASSQMRERAATVYNFEVENTHTYFVGHSDLWVHNLCVKWKTQYYAIHNRSMEAIEHIWLRHSFGASGTYADISRFSSRFKTQSQIKGLVTKACSKAEGSQIVTNPNGSKTITYTFEENIGVNRSGNATKRITVHLDANDAVRTAHPS